MNIGRFRNYQCFTTENHHPLEEIMVEKVDFWSGHAVEGCSSIHTSIILLLIHGGLLAHTAPEANLKQKRHLCLLFGKKKRSCTLCCFFCSVCNKNRILLHSQLSKRCFQKGCKKLLLVWCDWPGVLDFTTQETVLQRFVCVLCTA